LRLDRDRFYEIMQQDAVLAAKFLWKLAQTLTLRLDDVYTLRDAERGVVAYSGTGVRGYGNFVILVHPNGWVTAYAHHRRNLVVAGQLVERGEVIAEVGSTGFAQGPHLHFMLVSEGRHCDPMPLFRPALRREGVEHVEAVWDAELRPSVVQCLSREERPHPHYERGRRRR
ncbi:MAG: M23 family metallopeptidase, partial [Sandaracinaceae bacterium]|nr:M23 family metallopeptidase [Sandaracinaceae bacterium]